MLKGSENKRRRKRMMKEWTDDEEREKSDIIYFTVTLIKRPIICNKSFSLTLKLIMNL